MEFFELGLFLQNSLLPTLTLKVINEENPELRKQASSSQIISFSINLLNKKWIGFHRVIYFFVQVFIFGGERERREGGGGGGTLINNSNISKENDAGLK